MDNIFEEFIPHGIEGFVILLSNQWGETPTATDCKKYVADHDLTMTMLYDPSGASTIYGGMEISMVMDPAAKITFKVQGKWWAGIRNAIEDVLGYNVD